MSGVPAVYYHGTGSENAGRAYTEAPIQHVQRNALRKKCMKSTFTLLEKYAPRNTSFSFFVCLSVFHIRTHTYVCVFFFRHHRSPSLSFSFALYVSFYFSIWYRNPQCAIYRSTTISREFFLNRPASFIAFRTFLPSSILYGKCILIPKCISVHRVLL